MRTSHTTRTARTARTARLLAVTGAALAALTLTACDNGMGTQDEGSASATTDTTADAGTGTGTDGNKNAPNGGQNEKNQADKSSNTTGGTGSSGSSGTSGTSGSSETSGSSDSSGTDPDDRATCDGSNTAVTAQPVPRPLNHMLITVKNTGTKLCDLYYYPTLRFDEAQSAPSVIEDSLPQAVVTLAPGESGYAGVLLSAADGSGENGETARKAEIIFQGTTPGSDGGPSAHPSLPAQGVYHDSTLAVTYWQYTADDALAY